MLEFFYLTFWVAPKVFWFSFKEERKVKKLFYSHFHFKELDLLLKKLYRFKNPYKISKKYHQKKGGSSFHVYGETPLTVFHEMFQRGELTPSDCFVDLGCGRGRGVLFASSFWGSLSQGIEQIPYFVDLAKKIPFLGEVFEGEIERSDLTEGTFFYFYGICMEEEELKRVVSHLESMKNKAKIVSVSFPLTEYSTSFKVLSSWEALYPWGKTNLFLQVKKF